jgi:ankyrin repeat protein
MRSATRWWAVGWTGLLVLAAGCQESSEVPQGQSGPGSAPTRVAARGPKADELDARLLRAIGEGRSGPVEELLAQGASAQARTKAGKTALHLACAVGKVSIVQVLLEQGADPALQIPAVPSADGAGDDGAEAGSPLTYAAAQGNVEVVRLLLDRGVNVNTPTLDGKTALMCAANPSLPTGNHVACVALLLERGADAWVRNAQGRSALSLAGGATFNSAVQTNELRAQTDILSLLTRASTQR